MWFHFRKYALEWITLLNKMISKIEQNQLKYALLEVLNHIDTLDDLKPFMTNGEINF